MSKNYLKQGEAAYARQDKINSELLALTYGSLVVKLLKEESIEEVNLSLEKMGYNIGIRLIDEFLSKTNLMQCQSLQDTAEAVAKTAFKMFLNVNCDFSLIDQSTFILTFLENPLNEFVEIPEEYTSIWYSNLICGVIRGAFDMLQLQVKATYEKDVLKGDETNQIRVQVLQQYTEEYNEDF